MWCKYLANYISALHGSNLLLWLNRFLWQSSMMGSRVTGGNHGERCHVCHPSMGCRNTDGTPKPETNNLSVPSETGKLGLTIKLLESQAGKTDVTKSRQPWERSSVSCEHTHMLPSSRPCWVARWPLWALALSFSPRVSPRQCGEAELAQRCRAPTTSTLYGCPCPGQPQQQRAGASEHSVTRGSRGRPDREVCPEVAPKAAALGAAGVTCFAAG